MEEGTTSTDRFRFVERRACPACGSERSSTLVDLPFDSGPVGAALAARYEGRLDPATLGAGRYVLADCGACGLVYQRDVLDDDGLAHLYADVVSGSRSEVAGARGLPVRREYSFQVEQLLKYAARPPAEVRVLDFGAGWGLWCDMAAAYGCETIASEVSVERADTSEAHGHQIVPLEELAPGSLDFINTEQVFEHLARPQEVLGQQAAALRPGGLLRISVPNGAGLRRLLAAPDWSAPKGSPRSLIDVAPLEHVNCFDHGSLVRFGTQGGLERFDYPVRQALDQHERARFIVSRLVHAVRRPHGTMLLFRRP